MGLIKTANRAFYICLLVFPLVALSAPQTYEIYFTQTQGSIPAIDGQFTYDSSTGFSNFKVAWNGAMLDLTNAANFPSLFTTADGYKTGSHVDSFALLTDSLPQPRNYATWDAFVYDQRTFFGFTSGAGVNGVSESIVSINYNGPAVGIETPVQAGGFSSVYVGVAVPEPASGVMAAVGLGALVTLMRRNQRRASAEA